MASSQPWRPTNQAGSAIDRHVGQRLERQRGKAGISATALAEALGVDAATLAGWEAGRARISPHHLLAVGQLLSCPLTVFFEDFRPRDEDLEFSDGQADWLLAQASGAKH